MLRYWFTIGNRGVDNVRFRALRSIDKTRLSPKRRRVIGATAGFGSIAAYAVFSLAAYALYPAAFSPAHNPLSDLGNPWVNTSGAVVYEIGVMLTSVFIMVFAVSLGLLKRHQDRVSVGLLNVGRAAGVVCGLSFVLVGIFPLGPYPTAHAVTSGILWFGMVFFEAFLAASFMKMHIRPKWVAYLGFFAVLVEGLGSLVILAYFMEWVTIAFALTFMGAAAYVLLKNPTTDNA